MDPSTRPEPAVAPPAGESAGPHSALAADRLQTALDASCAALLALEQARAALSDAPRDLWRTQRAEAQAIELVRVAITDLRRTASTAEAEPLAFGFVHAGIADERDADEQSRRGQ